jgi:glycosyltransferase involved in cell wall biosynthesis
VSAPFVSVVVPAWNAEGFLAETVESVLGQTWQRREVIVVDDGSTDRTADVVARFGRRVRFLRQENRGGGAARNAGCRLAQGDHVVFLDHDDLLERDALARQLEVAARHPASGLVAADGVRFEGDEVVGHGLLHGRLAALADASPGGEWTGDAYRALLRGNALSTPGQALVPRRVIEEVGPLSERRDEPFDYEYWLRIALRRPVTVHRARAVRWRYRPSGRSGPGELRRLTWALMDLPVLERHLTLAPPSARRAVRAALRKRARRARLAWVHGRRHGMAGARGLLRRLARAAPLSPWPRLWWLATWAPGFFVEPLAARGLAGTSLPATESRA